MPQTKARAKRCLVPKDLEKAIAELDALLDLPMEKRASDWGERVRKLNDHITKEVGS